MLIFCSRCRYAAADDFIGRITATERYIKNKITN